MEKFSLKWNDFTSKVQKSFRNLRTEDDFFDITLVGDDYKHVTAHKVVLSSCSEYFKGVFSNNKKHFQSHAFICLEGLNHRDLNNVLDYIYQGEVQIHQEELDRFLGIAQRLKLEGLIGGEEQDDKIEGLIGGKEQKDDDDDNSILEDKIITQQENVSVTERENNILKKRGIIESQNISNLAELDQKVEESYSKEVTGCYQCHYCSKSFKLRGHIKEHVEIHFGDLSLPCSVCDSTHRCRKSLRNHVYRYHK